MEVPTAVSYSSLQQHTSEEIADTPAPGGGRLHVDIPSSGGGRKGLRPRQNSTAPPPQMVDM